MADYDDPQAHDHDPNVEEEVDDSSAEDEPSAVPDGLQSAELIRLVSKAAGRDLYVGSVAQSALAQSNWGGLLGAAPDALGRLGQCFVLASHPLASSLMIPEGSGLQYKSLKANLVRCSDLGRTTFREAEGKMRKISAVAHAVCEPLGTIDMILEDVEHDDLVEVDLPERLAMLKRSSQACTQDTKAIRALVGEWAEYAKAIHRACVEKDDDLGNEERDLGDQAELQKESVKMKHAQVDESKQQTNQYREQLQDRQREYTQAEKSYEKGEWKDMLMTVIEGGMDIAKSFITPWSLFSGRSRSPGGRSSSEEHYVPDSNDPLHQQDRGYAMAECLVRVIHQLAELLTIGPDDSAGVNWDALSRRPGQHILIQIQDFQRQFVNKPTAVAMKVRAATEPAEEVALEIRRVSRDERNMNSDTPKKISELGPIWRKKVKDAESAICNIIEAGLEAAKEAANAQKEKREKGERRNTGISRAEIRFQRLRIAQQALLEAETRLNTRLEEDLKMTQEFNAMELKLMQLLSSKATMAQVKEIVAECVKHLQSFCEKLDELGAFFTHLQDFVEDMDRSRVDPFSTTAITTKTLGDRAKKEESEAARARKEKMKERKLQELKLRALELKGYYLVAGAMADTYVEVSTNHIIPAVNEVDRLSRPEAKSLSKEQRAAKITEVGKLAKEAKHQVKQLANARKRELISAMTIDRGEIEEIRELQQ
ncbi:hypothetical protein F4861DRAFT_542653 [Xylaria intraflava]|nr:hypothetical protein F4861DRAFT_542653 [Xylaria intraflava]